MTRKNFCNLEEAEIASPIKQVLMKFVSHGTMVGLHNLTNAVLMQPVFKKVVDFSSLFFNFTWYV